MKSLRALAPPSVVRGPAASASPRSLQNLRLHSKPTNLRLHFNKTPRGSVSTNSVPPVSPPGHGSLLHIQGSLRVSRLAASHSAVHLKKQTNRFSGPCHSDVGVWGAPRSLRFKSCLVDSHAQPGLGPGLISYHDPPEFNSGHVVGARERGMAVKGMVTQKSPTAGL